MHYLQVNLYCLKINYQGVANMIELDHPELTFT